MKIAVISDSHDNTANLKKAVATANQKGCNYLFHLGDIIAPFSVHPLKEFGGQIKAVYGNCDGERFGLQKVFNNIGGEINVAPFKLTLDNKSIVLMHEPYLLEEIVKSQEMDYIFYGHLHKVDCRKEGKTWILNPGESGGWTGKATFYIVDTLTGENTQFDL